MKNNKSLVLLLKIVVVLVVIASIVITTTLVIKKTRRNKVRHNIHDIIKNNVKNNNMKNNNMLNNNGITLDDLCKRYINFAKNIKGSTLNNTGLSHSQKMAACRSEMLENYDISPNTKYIGDNVELMALYNCLSGSNSMESLIECIAIKALQSEYPNENNWN